LELVHRFSWTADDHTDPAQRLRENLNEFWLALLICIFGTVGLLFLDRDKSWEPPKPSGCRSSGSGSSGQGRLCLAWINPGVEEASQLIEGSPATADFRDFAHHWILVLVRRGRRTAVLLRANWLILIYFAYCLASVWWSDFPEIAFKRWTKSIGDLVMVFIVLTELDPSAAFRRFSRVGFVLLPASVLFTSISAT